MLTEKHTGSSRRKVFQLRDSTVREDVSLFTACMCSDAAEGSVAPPSLTKIKMAKVITDCFCGFEVKPH